MPLSFRTEFRSTMREVTPERVDQAVNVHITAARNMVEHMKRDLERLGYARQRRAVLDELPDSEDNAPDFNDLATFARK